ncbi:transcription factor SEF1 [Apiospora hydei]|uniref:Transcription factor SEF1 n=1 Tax=Apiospora hydei TaxID=1337664 RepID=A0ABR1V445_9PEZI
MSSTQTILVTGATGKQGGALIDHLLASPRASRFDIVAVTRDIQSSRAQKLSSRGDLTNPDAIFEAAGPVWGVYSVQVNSDAEESQGKALIDAAILHGAKHFVYSSGDRGGPERSETNPTNVKNFTANAGREKSAQGMTYTILRPVTFFENLSGDIHGKGFARMWEQLGQKKLQFVATQDIGWFAAQSFLNPEKHRNRAVTLVGDELTQPEADVIFKKVMGTSMPMSPCPIASAVKMVLKDTVGDMFKWFKAEGYGGDIESCRGVYPEMQSFEAWLVDNKGRWVD